MKQPKAFYLLTWIQMWRFFSNFGMRALLILYFVNGLHLSDDHAFGINAVFFGVVALSGIFGGLLADRILGLKRAIGLGCLASALGYLGFIFENGIYFALPMITLGGTLVAGNITALLGEVYQENEERRKEGFTFFYMIGNLGAFVSTFLCSVVAEIYGYHVGFGVAALGMIIGALSFFWGRNALHGLGDPPKVKRSYWWILALATLFIVSGAAIYFENVTLPLLPWITAAIFSFFAVKLLKSKDLSQEKVRLFLLYLGAFTLFFAVQDQICSSLVVFAERVVDRTVGGLQIPSSIVMSINPIVVVLLGALIAKLRLRLLAPFVLMAAVFGVLSYICLQKIALSIFSLTLMIAIVAIAELMIGPFVYSFASEVAARGKAGVVMGMLPISASLSFLLSGKFSQMLVISDNNFLYNYGIGFGKIALIVLVGGLVIEFLTKKIQSARAIC